MNNFSEKKYFFSSFFFLERTRFRVCLFRSLRENDGILSGSAKSFRSIHTVKVHYVPVIGTLVNGTYVIGTKFSPR